MQFIKDITFTKGKTEQTIETTDLKVSGGIIHRINIQFPAGCAGLVNVQIYDGGHPIAPTTQGQYYRGDDEIVEFNEFYPIIIAPRLLTIKGFNTDDTYNHQIQVRIFILPKEVLLPVGATEGILAGLKRLVLRPIVIKESEESKS